MELVTLRRIRHRDKDCLAMFFKPVLQVTEVIRTIPGVAFTITHKCWYVENTPANLECVLKKLNSVAKIDQSELLADPSDAHKGRNPPSDLSTGATLAIKALSERLMLQGYSEATQRTLLRRRANGQHFG